MLTATLNEIRKHGPCTNGWATLLKGLNKAEADDEPLAIMQVLEISGIEDALWVLRCFDYKEYGLFLADVAESVLHIYEAKYCGDAPRSAIEGIHKYRKSEISKGELRGLSYDAYAAAINSTYATYAAYAAYAAYMAAATYNDHPPYAADAAVYTAAVAAAADDNSNGASDYVTPTGTETTCKTKWVKIEQFFIKHFGV